MAFYHQSVEETYHELRTKPEGISGHEANLRLAHYGLNTIRLKAEPLWRTLIEPFANIFMLVLFVAAIISFIHHAVFDAIIILVIIAVSALIYYIQKFSTERILRSLQKHSTQQVEVLRHGESVIMDATRLVPGDVIRLNEGDKVPADVRLTRADAVRVDESILTGESVPVSKATDTLGEHRQVYEQTNMLFQGSFLIAGQATGVVTLTANHTEFGRIAALSQKSPDANRSPVQKKIDSLLSRIVIVVGALAVVAFILALARGVEFTDALRFVMALSVSAVPESLPIAISVILVLGMRRMAAKKALVRTMRAIETVGVITTIATDKTGTLTENKLSVQEVWQPQGSAHHLPTIAHRTINHHSEHTRDPLDVAMIEFTSAEASVELKGEVVTKLPFDQAFSMSGNVWHHKGRYDLVMKGAPEQIMARSHLSEAQSTEAEHALQALTTKGYRVIALASVKLTAPLTTLKELPPSLHFEFVGFLAVADTLRPAARRAIHAAQSAGVSVRMITGDHFETAYQIGKQMGLIESREQVFDSRQIDELSDSQLKKRILDAGVFSRVTPENKFRILKILKLKEITAMTGDGVNDVPALSNAHVGIAMGSGSQIAKDASDIILLNDNFASIVHAMKEGRIVFANIRRMLFYLLSTNAGEVIVMIGALVVGMPMPLAPVQILWINLVTDTAMVIPLGLEKGEKGVMRQKPLTPSAPILSKYMMSRIILVALTMGVLTVSLYGYFSARYGVAYGQTIAFTSLVVMQWANAFNARSAFESVVTRLRVWNRVFYIGLAASIILQLLAVLGPLQTMLHIHPIALGDLFTTSLAAFLILIIVVEVHKFFGRRYIHLRVE